MEILCFDTSGSTSNCTNYWNAVENLVKANKFDALLSWNTTCRLVKNVLETVPCYGTSPRSFMDYILSEFNKDYIANKYGKDAELVLQVTTDGQILDRDITDCAEYLNKPDFPRLKTVTVHYIGNESAMNFGLNAIFGSVAELCYTVNDIDTTKRVPSVEELENYEDIFSTEFLSFLCSRVTDLKTNNFDAFNRLRKKLLFKIEAKHEEVHEPIFPKDYFDKDDAEGFEKVLKDKLFSTSQSAYQNWKNKIITCFDKCSSITLADVRGRSDFKSNVLTESNTVDGYQIDEDIAIEDSITFGNIDDGKICFLVKFDQPALFDVDSKYVKNPFLVFQDASTQSQMIKRFELHPLSISSVKRLIKEGSGIVKSPFTRDDCRAFILGPSNINEINFNSLALATFFKSDLRNIIYGSKFIWQLIVLYLIKIHIDSTIEKDESVAWPSNELQPLVNALLKEYVFNEKILYPLTLHVKLSLPVKRVPLYVSLWYIIRVAPFFAPNSSRNILRYPRTSILLKLFQDLNTDGKIASLDSDTNEKLHIKHRIWKLWNEMLDRRHDPELKLVVRAAYQNYCVVLGKIVLLSGARPDELPPPELVSGIPASIVKNMLDSLSPQSTRFDPINEDESLLKSPNPQILPFNRDGPEGETVYHMQIDPNTLRPTEICPVTNRPWLECAGEFDVKSESYARIFSLYCEEYGHYPESSDQLVLLHNRKRAINRVSNIHIVNYMKYVFEIHQPMAKSMQCSEFIKKYGNHRPYGANNNI